MGCDLLPTPPITIYVCQNTITIAGLKYEPYHVSLTFKSRRHVPANS